jgi:hypothetical protein
MNCDWEFKLVFLIVHQNHHVLGLDRDFASESSCDVDIYR